MKGALLGFVGYFMAAVLALLLLPIGIILMILFTVSDWAVRLFKKVFP